VLREGKVEAYHGKSAWSGPKTVDDFINISKAGKEKGVFIMHRECGTLAELNSSQGRAIGKMKATITHRFIDEATGGQYDVDCDCRFIFFCEKVPVSEPVTNGHVNGYSNHTNGNYTNGNSAANGASVSQEGVHIYINMRGCGSEQQHQIPAANTAAVKTEWKAKYVKLFYEKDKVVPTDGFTAPRFSADELAKYPEGYKYLGAAQARLGYPIDVHLPTARNDLWDRMYGEMEKWLEGQTVDLFWEPGVAETLQNGTKKVEKSNGVMAISPLCEAIDSQP
jgi:hypothetical protein